jgi:hypothetical protein
VRRTDVPDVGVRLVDGDVEMRPDIDAGPIWRQCRLSNGPGRRRKKTIERRGPRATGLRTPGPWRRRRRTSGSAS